MARSAFSLMMLIHKAIDHRRSEPFDPERAQPLGDMPCGPFVLYQGGTSDIAFMGCKPTGEQGVNSRCCILGDAGISDTAKLRQCGFCLCLGATSLGSGDDFTVGSRPLQEGTPLVAIAIDAALAKRPSTSHSFTLAGCLSGCLWGLRRGLG